MFSRDPENLPFIIGYHLEEILGVDGRRKSRLDIKHYSNEICFWLDNFYAKINTRSLIKQIGFPASPQIWLDISFSAFAYS